MHPVRPDLADDVLSPAHPTADESRVASFVFAHGRTLAWSLVAVVAVSVAARLAVPIPATPVPVSLQDLVVMLIGVVLGPVAGTSAVITYLGVGAMGAPVFSNGHAGFLWLVGPTGGYLLAYPAACWVVAMAARSRHGQGRLVGGVLLAQVLIFGGGVLQLGALTGQSMQALLPAAVIPFIPGAILKIAFVLAFAQVWRKWRAPGRPSTP